MSLGDGSAAEGASRRDRLVMLVAASSSTRVVTSDEHGLAGRRVLIDRLGRVCSVSMSELGVSGAGVTVMASLSEGLAGHRSQVCSTGPTTRRLEDLQLTTGEGPCLDAYASGTPVLSGDMRGDSCRWLAFGREALQAGAAAVFSFPLQVGAVRLGTLDLYRDLPGALAREQLADALVLAQLATETLLELADEPQSVMADEGSEDLEAIGWLPEVNVEVHQASGMVAAREGISVGSALLRLRARAFGRGLPIAEVARRILSREMVLDDDIDDP